MSILEIMDSLLFKPLQLLFEVIYTNANNVIGNPGLSIIVLSLVMNFLVLPLYRRADALQEEERNTEAKLSKGVSHIKKTFRGDEKMMILQTYYRQNEYKPTYVLRSAVSLLLEIPFFISAYRFLSGLELLQGVAFGPIANLGLPDGLIAVGGMHINVLPVIMTAVNLVSCVIFTKGAPTKTKVQLYGMAIFFLFFLYDSPSGLVFYWTLNNVFSLVKTIFYKLKNPQKVLSILASAVGNVLIVYVLGFYHAPRPVVKTVVCLLGLVLQLPVLGKLLKKNKKESLEKEHKAHTKLFFACGLFLALFVGAYIPLSVIASSAQEFVNIRNYQSPLWFVVSSFSVAVGAFVIWFGVFYWLASPKGKVIFEKAIFALVGVAIVDFMFFGKNLGVMSSTLGFNEGLQFQVSEICLNAVVVVVVAAAMCVIERYFNKYIFRIVTVVILAIAIMVPVNIVNINSQVKGIRQAADESGEVPSYTMSTDGKNVIVLMMDRAVGRYLPYIFNEKPELREQFSGFTAYTNVVSAGAYTNFGTPSLFGGYEYTVENMNLRKDEKLEDKQNEALKVMPVLFDSNGYEVTVFDPPYAGYQWIPDLSIYSDYPSIHTYNTDGAYESREVYQSWTNTVMRNFFMYGLMKVSPAALQKYIYNRGDYNGSSVELENMSSQTTTSPHQAVGISYGFANAYNVLDNLNQIVQVKESDQNTFLMMSNSTTHEPILLQEPEYTPVNVVENTEYDLEHSDRFTVNGEAIRVENENQYAHYETNMAALIKLGQWFDDMREHGVYDNTRIILVADHGHGDRVSEKAILPDEIDSDWFFPLLMVKDFNADGFSFSDAFMTTADVPTLATNGVIENPKNPFTGNSIHSAHKKENATYVFFSWDWDTNVNNGNQFLPGDWYRIDNQNKNDLNNWVKVGTKTVFPDDFED